MLLMEIGLDFDGVISDCGQLKSEGARRMYGVDIPPGKFKKEIVVGEELLTLKQYRELQEEIYGRRKIGMKMAMVPGARYYINALQQEGHRVRVVTSRGEVESEIARDWIGLRGLDLPLIGVGGESKADACKGLDVYMDDDLDKLEQVKGVVKNLFLFDWEYNLHMEVPKNLAARVNSWAHFYGIIHEDSRLIFSD